MKGARFFFFVWQQLKAIYIVLQNQALHEKSESFKGFPLCAGVVDLPLPLLAQGSTYRMVLWSCRDLLSWIDQGTRQILEQVNDNHLT